MVASLHSPEQWDSVPRLPFQFPESDQLWNELRLFVETDSTYDTIQAVSVRGREGGRREGRREGGREGGGGGREEGGREEGGREGGGREEEGREGGRRKGGRAGGGKRKKA